jgi:triosephosphate isomerase (TIM)
LAAQNAYYKDEGAFTGEVSYTMLRELVHYAIIGHSERRMYFDETLEVVRDKVAACVRNEIIPILCIGETKHERLQGEAQRVIHDQLTTALFHLTSEDVENMVIAYEPVWAIGSGAPAKPDEIAEVIKWIKYNLRELYGAQVAESTRLLYGGSTEPEFAHSLLSIEGVDGLLVGGASLNYQKFAAIVDAAYRLGHERPTDG